MSGVRVVYLARHGETDWNAEGRLQGQTDVPLNALGRAQALALGAALRSAGIQSVGTSDLSRALGTAEIAAVELGVRVSLVDRGLRERAYGIFEGLTHEEARERAPEAWASFMRDQTTPPGAETLAAVAERMREAVLRAAGALRSPALVVSHGRAIRELVSAVSGVAIPPIRNGAIFRVVVAEGRLLTAEAVSRDA